MTGLLAVAFTVWAFLNAQAGWILIAGLVVVGGFNAWQWRRDAQRARQLAGAARPAVILPSTPCVSILVAAWNEADIIRQHIESVLALRYPNKEYIVCAGGGDDTYALARQYAGEQVRVLEQMPGEGKQRALRRCLEQATGEVIFLTDADCWLADDAFETTLSALLNDGDAAATGRFAPLAAQRQDPFVLMQWCVDNYARAHSQPYVEGLIGRNAALQRALLRRTGDFSAAVPIGTDYYLARQIVALGERIRYVHASAIETAYATMPRTYLRQQSRWLRNILQHGAAFGARAQARQALWQCLAGLGILLGLLILPWLGEMGRVAWVLLLAQGTLARFRYIRFGEMTLRFLPRLALYLLAPLYLVLDMCMLSYALVEWRVPRLRWLW